MTKRFATALLALASQSWGGQALWVSGKVVAGTAPDGSGSSAPSHAGVVILRDNVPGESAKQLAGPDALDPMRIFSPPQSPAYFLTDAGSQWPTALSVGQVVLSVCESMPPLHGMGGTLAYAGASSSVV